MGPLLTSPKSVLGQADHLSGFPGPGPTEPKGLGSKLDPGIPNMWATKERAVWSTFLQP